MVDGFAPEDPGWQPVMRKLVPWVLVPGGIERLSKEGDGQPPVFAARALFWRS
jgi:hypothetical protein